MRSIAALRCAALASLAVGIALAGQAQPVAPYPIGHGLPVFEAPDSPSAVTPDPPAEPTGAVQLEQALALALLRNPELAADAYELRAREAGLLQAGALPNPTVSVELEDFAGSGQFHGVDEAQTTLLLGQLIELGGKRAARVEIASADRDLARWDFEVRRIEVLVRTADAFVDVLAAQQRQRLAEEALEVARSLQRVASQRLRAGIASPAEEIRAGVLMDVAEVEREHSEHELATARQELVASWGGDAPRFEHAVGDLEQLPAVPSSATLAAQLATSPGVARWQTEFARRAALQTRATSERIPDVSLHAGPRYHSGPDDAALVVGFALPLPLWDRRRGAVLESEFRQSRLASESRAARLQTATELEAARVALQASSEEARLLRTRVLPGTQRVVEALRRGYEQGRIPQSEVLEAESARLDAREQYLAALTEAHHSAQRIERLTGVPLEVVP
jgi:cobalt-zinc-cadmium efflux system outer membrane protein